MSLSLPFQTEFLSLGSWDLSIAQALLKSPIAYSELFQPSLILKTSTNQLKNMPGCISVPGTIITELKNSNLNFLLADPFFFYPVKL